MRKYKNMKPMLGAVICKFLSEWLQKDGLICEGSALLFIGKINNKAVVFSCVAAVNIERKKSSPRRTINYWNSLQSKTSLSINIKPGDCKWKKKRSLFALNFSEQKTKPPFVISSKSKDVHVIASHIKEETAENESVLIFLQRLSVLSAIYNLGKPVWCTSKPCCLQ